MAITSLKSKVFIDSTERGVTCVTQIGAKPGQQQPIYIPKLMPYLVRGGLVTQSVVTNGNMMFVNDNKCKPNAPSIVKTQNYVSPKFESNGTWKSIVENPNRDPIPKGTGVHVTFASGNILTATFNAG